MEPTLFFAFYVVSQETNEVSLINSTMAQAVNEYWKHKAIVADKDNIIQIAGQDVASKLKAQEKKIFKEDK